jgi:hypothetical protein
VGVEAVGAVVVSPVAHHLRQRELGGGDLEVGRPLQPATELDRALQLRLGAGQVASPVEGLADETVHAGDVRTLIAGHGAHHPPAGREELQCAVRIPPLLLELPETAEDQSDLAVGPTVGPLPDRERLVPERVGREIVFTAFEGRDGQVVEALRHLPVPPAEELATNRERFPERRLGRVVPPRLQVEGAEMIERHRDIGVLVAVERALELERLAEERFGPVIRALAALDQAQAELARRDLAPLVARRRCQDAKRLAEERLGGVGAAAPGQQLGQAIERHRDFAIPRAEPAALDRERLVVE